MIGEPISSLFLTPYDKDWPKAFEVEKRYLKKILNNFTYVIEHVGSTAVKGLRSRPIIDIAIGVGNVYDQIAIKDILNLSGYVYDAEQSSLDCFSFYRVIDNRIYFTVKVLIFNSNAWNLIINIRNYLITNKDAKEKYEQVKLDIFRGVNNNKKDYVAYKKRYMQHEMYPKFQLDIKKHTL